MEDRRLSGPEHAVRLQLSLGCQGLDQHQSSNHSIVLSGEVGLRGGDAVLGFGVLPMWSPW